MSASLPALPPPVPPSSVRGVLGGRVLAFFLDIVIVTLLWSVFWVALAVLGFLTFGLAWLFLGPLFPLVAVIYNGFTISGPRRGTIGMRMAGIELRMLDGAPVSFVVAAVHAIFFYVTVVMITPLVLIVGPLRRDRRLLHDLLAGVIAVRSLP